MPLVATSAALVERGRQRDEARHVQWNVAGVGRSCPIMLKYLSLAQARRGVVQTLRVLVIRGAYAVSG